MARLTGHEINNLFQRRIVISFKYKGGCEEGKVLNQNLAAENMQL